MKIKRPSSKKWIIMAAIAVAIIIIATAGVYYYKNHSSTNDAVVGVNSVDYGPATKEQQLAGEQTGDPSGTGSDPLPKPTPQTNSKSLVDVTITSANQSGSNLRINSLISAVDNNGSCTVTLTKDNVTVKKEVGVQALSSSSTCKGFIIPVSELSKGTWELVLTFENDALTGTAKQTVQID